jgi:cytochrome c-type biogenesis protein
VSLTATVTSGSLLLAVPIALLAGLVSFLSPCVLPLVPGYLSFVTGLAGADLDRSPRLAAAPRGRILAGASLFVLGFSVVFVSAGVAFGSLGMMLQQHARGLSRVLGALTILLGLAFMGVVPGFARDLRIHRLPRVGLLGAPVLGLVFGLGWAPCIGPTLAAVQVLAFTSASAGRGAFLAFVYCLGLGLPFVIAALAFRRALGAFAVIRRHSRAITVTGGVTLVVLGLLLVTGVWDSVTIWMRHLVAGYTTAL